MLSPSVGGRLSSLLSASSLATKAVTRARAPQHVLQLTRGYKRNRRRVDVILMEDHPKLGYKGQVASVRPGYGRNYLMPKGLAVYAIPENRELYELGASEAGEGKEDERNTEIRAYFDDLRIRLSKITIELSRKPNQKQKKDRTEDSVTSQQVVQKLWMSHELFQVEACHLMLPQGLRDADTFGDHVCMVDFRRFALPLGIQPDPAMEPFTFKVHLAVPPVKKMGSL